MLGLSKTTIALLASFSTVVLSAGGYGVSTLFSDIKSEKVIEVQKQRKNLWEYAMLYGGNGQGEMCDFLEKNEEESDRTKRLKIFEETSVICQSTWAKQLIEKNKNSKGLWIVGQSSNEVDKLLKNSDSQVHDFLDSILGDTFEKEKRERTVSELLSKKQCKKTNELENNTEEWIELVCRN